MAKSDVSAAIGSLKVLLSGDDDFVRDAVRGYLQDVLKEEMTATVGAGKGERSLDQLGYRSGYYERALVTRVGRIELRVPQDGRFSSALFERYQRSQKALVSALTQMYVQGVSTRKVKKITEEQCGYRFSASTISNIVKRGQLHVFARRRLDEPFPYLIVDARYAGVGPWLRWRRVSPRKGVRALLEPVPHHLRGNFVFAKRDGSRYGKLTRGLAGAAKHAGIKDLRWHDLRRTCGSWMLQDGVRIEVVSKWLGHGSIVVTERSYAFPRTADLHAAAWTQHKNRTGHAD